jgi:hypothetical protein
VVFWQKTEAPVSGCPDLSRTLPSTEKVFPWEKTASEKKKKSTDKKKGRLWFMDIVLIR